MRNSIGYYAGFLMLLAFLGGVWLAVWHIARVARKVRTLISQATDESPAAEIADVALPAFHDFEATRGEHRDFDAWEAECACRPRIARYVAKLEERAR